MSDKTNELSQDEIDALNLWSSGKTMTDAYCEVMQRKGVNIKKLQKQTLNKRVQRFFGSELMKKAMLITERGRDEKLKKDAAKQKAIDTYGTVVKNVKPKIMKAAEAEKKEGITREREIAKEGNRISEFIDKVVLPNVTSPNAVNNTAISKVEEVTKTNDIQDVNIANKSAREKWLESLMITEDPSAISVYGTGQFIMYHAVSEMMKRDKAIKEHRHGTNIFDKNGTVFTPLILNAMKTAASMIIPFVPTQEMAKDNGTSVAVTLLGLMQDNIKEDPDDYTAPIPPTVTIDVTNDNNEDGEQK